MPESIIVANKPLSVGLNRALVTFCKNYSHTLKYIRHHSACLGVKSCFSTDASGLCLVFAGEGAYIHHRCCPRSAVPWDNDSQVGCSSHSLLDDGDNADFED